jgi:protein arginine kinase activator
MMCDNCRKHPATVHLTEIIDDQISELHLCEQCAHKKSAQMEQQFGLSDLLAGLADLEKPAAKTEEESAVIKCPTCGMTYKDFRKTGRLGCGDCYNAFKSFLGPLLKRIHGTNNHCGKCPIPAKSAVKPGRRKGVGPAAPDIGALKCRLQKAVELEAYEEAARIRDQIKELEKKQQPEARGQKD